MKKYFVAGTEEEIQFGDTVGITLVKEEDNGRVTVEKEMVFTPDNLDWMLKMDFVEEDEEDDENTLEFTDEPCEGALNDLIEDFETLEERVDGLENRCDKFFHLLTKEFDELMSMVKQAINSEKKQAPQPKKK